MLFTSVVFTMPPWKTSAQAARNSCAGMGITLAKHNIAVRSKPRHRALDFRHRNWGFMGVIARSSESRCFICISVDDWKTVSRRQWLRQNPNAVKPTGLVCVRVNVLEDGAGRRQAGQLGPTRKSRGALNGEVSRSEERRVGKECRYRGAPD